MFLIFCFNKISPLDFEVLSLYLVYLFVFSFSHLKHKCKLPGPHLVIAPKSTLHNWMAEFNRWCPSLKAISLMGEKTARVIYSIVIVLPIE